MSGFGAGVWSRWSRAQTRSMRFWIVVAVSSLVLVGGVASSVTTFWRCSVRFSIIRHRCRIGRTSDARTNRVRFEFDTSPPDGLDRYGRTACKRYATQTGLVKQENKARSSSRRSFRAAAARLNSAFSETFVGAESSSFLAWFSSSFSVKSLVSISSSLSSPKAKSSSTCETNTRVWAKRYHSQGHLTDQYRNRQPRPSSRISVIRAAPFSKKSPAIAGAATKSKAKVCQWELSSVLALSSSRMAGRGSVSVVEVLEN